MNVPILLIFVRLVFAPIILSLAYYGGEKVKPAILILMYIGLTSDILDGIIARYKNQSSEKLRRMDSQADMIFWLSIGFATWLLYPHLIEAHLVAIRILLAMEVSCYAISIMRFKKETCTHAYLSKLWGITLLIAFTSLIGFNHAGLPFTLAIITGLVSHIDRILITLILPTWTHDVPSAYHALLIKKGKDFKRNKLFNG
jgi:cardiolipin synthase